MADKFDEIVAAKRRKREPNIGGSFDCQTCGVYVDGAFYDAVNSTLTWECNDGHTSNIKEVNF